LRGALIKSAGGWPFAGLSVFLFQKAHFYTLPIGFKRSFLFFISGA